MSGLHRTPKLDALTHLTKDVAARATHLRTKLTRQTLTRVTGGVAVGAALVASIAATVTVTDNGAPRSGTSLAVTASHDGVNGILAAAPKGEQAAAPLAVPMRKRKKAPAHPRRPVKAEDVIRLAKKQVGLGETNGRGGGTKFQNWYARSDFAEHTAARDGATPGMYKDAAWCAMFITWLGDNFNFNDQMGGDAYTVTMARWFADHGRWGHKPKPGAVVFFDWAGSKTIGGIDHVGLVTKVNSDGTVNTVEGNISDSVVTKTRALNQIAGFGHPDYAK